MAAELSELKLIGDTKTIGKRWHTKDVERRLLWKSRIENSQNPF